MSLRLWQRTGTWGAFAESVADYFVRRDLPDRNLFDQVVDSPVVRGYSLQTRWLVIRSEMAPLSSSPPYLSVLRAIRLPLKLALGVENPRFQLAEHQTKG